MVFLNLNLKLHGGWCLAEAGNAPLKQENTPDVEGEAPRAKPAEKTPCVCCMPAFLMSLLRCSLMAV